MKHTFPPFAPIAPRCSTCGLSSIVIAANKLASCQGRELPLFAVEQPTTPAQVQQAQVNSTRRLFRSPS